MTDFDPTLPINPDDTRTAAGAAATGATAALPARVGRYRPLRILGRGGMGVVYEAEQDEPRRRVALKVIRPELATDGLRRRFAHESLFLGRLQHPGIAQVYEAGTAETAEGPVPFIAMELVEGTRLGVWTEGHHPDLRTRIALMIALCDAVHHAHQRGLIHRDLKPGNILVDADGRPRVLDFGVARPADADLGTSLVTSHGELVGTIAYMSPEQLGGDPNDLDTRSDVYALGIILYELLCGRPPLELGNRPLEDALRAIREEDPPTLSTHDPHLAGDLSIIAATAMAKDREQRYASANALAMDLRRFLDDEPIAARAPGTLYLLRKFARRHRPLVFGVTGVAATLVLGIVVSTWLAVRAHRAEHLAQARLEQAESVTDFLQKMLAAIDPREARGREVTVHEALDRAASDLDKGRLADRPEVEMALRQTLGNTYESLGQVENAESNLRRSLALADSLLEPTDVQRLNIALDLSRTVRNRGDMDLAEQMVLAEMPRIPAGTAVSSRALFQLADARYAQGRWVAADSLQRLAQADLARSGVPDSMVLAEILVGRAFVAEQRQQYDLADSLADGAEGIYGRAFGADDPRMIRVLNKRTDIATDLGRFKDAETFGRRAEAIVDANYPPDHPLRADTAWRLGVLFERQGNVAAAAQEYEKALDLRRRVLGPVHRDIALALQSLGNVEASLKEFDLAEVHQNEALAMRRELFGPIHPSVASSLQDRGGLERRRGRPAVAESLYVEAGRIIAQLPEETGDQASKNESMLAIVIREQGRLDEAEAHQRKSLEIRRRQYDGPHLAVATSLTDLAAFLFRVGKKAEAVDRELEALAMLRTLGIKGNDLLVALGNTAFMLDDAGRHAEAEPLHREFIDVSGDVHGIRSPDQRGARERLFDNLVQQKKWTEAEAEARAVMAARESRTTDSEARRTCGTILLAEAWLGQGRVAQADSLLTAFAPVAAAATDLPEQIARRLPRLRADVETRRAGT